MPESEHARFVVPVLPRTTPASVGSRVRRVPLRPATASDPTNAFRMRGFSRPARMTATSVSAVIRSSDERPEPSTRRTPAIGMRAAAISASTVLAPRALVPTCPSSVPRCLSSISAVKLSLSRFIVLTMTDRLAERSVARTTAPVGARPRPGRPVTAMPCATSASRSALAASSGGDSAGQPFARSTTRAESGGVSPPTKYFFHPSPPRRRSKTVSSPRTRPVTLLMPEARNEAARRPISAVVSVGSPLPRR
jgi:hypothetical protein